MGTRIYVASTYNVSYGASPGLFNWQMDKFKDLLIALDVSYSGEMWDYQFEVDVDDFKKGIAHITDKNYENRDEVLACLREFDYPNYTDEECAKDLRKYLDAADISDGWLHFSYF